MPYSQARLTHTVVLVRVFTGVVFAMAGWNKIASFDFARFVFPAHLVQAVHGGAAGWYSDLLRTFAIPSPGKVAIIVGFVLLAIGIGLVLGLAVRPMCALGAFYAVNIMLATWNQLGPREPWSRWLQFQMPQIFTLFVLVLLGVAHAGEHWGLGALYHRRRIRREKELSMRLAEEEAESEPEAAPHTASA